MARRHYGSAQVTYLTCPTCRFTVRASGSTGSHLQACPRCTVRGRERSALVIMPSPPSRFQRPGAGPSRREDAGEVGTGRFSGPARAGRSA